MSGTPFNTGQLGKLQNEVNIAVATALPKVAEKFPDPKKVLKALENKGEILAQRLEVALAQAIGSMMLLIPRDTVSLGIAERHDPDAYYRDRSGLYVWGGMRDLVVAHAKPTERGTNFKLASFDLGQNAIDKQIEEALPKEHLFGESAACAIIATMIAMQPGGGAGPLLNNGYANLFYLSSCVVYVHWHAGARRWHVSSWERDVGGWGADDRVFSPAT